MENEKVADYYDHLIAMQAASGVNERIYHLYKMLRRFGLKSSSNILELGSGIGTLTLLLSKYVKRGKIEAVDLSTKSIDFAARRIKGSNISFVTDDVVSYQPALKNIDFITLFDIIEHIPMENHQDLFGNLSRIANQDTKILINIPNPDYIEYDRENNPEVLQIIDQPLPLSFILDNLELNGLSLRQFETYSVWMEDDYQLFVIEKKKKFKEVALNSKRNILQKIRKRLEQTYVRFRYNYS